jgi:hypothetical protein
MPYSAHCVWSHEIDSKGPGISDEGDMFLLPNGDCMEVGMMHNPKSGNVDMYKEYWTSPRPSAELHLTPCIVAKTKELPHGHEGQEASIQIGRGGVIIRIGDYCQGIMHQQSAGHEGSSGPSAVLVERWTRGLFETDPSSRTAREEPETATSSGWIQDWRSNTPADTGDSMPCLWALEDDRKLGDEIVVKGTTWRIVEAVVDRIEDRKT